jgi:hypothetical protein
MLSGEKLKMCRNNRRKKPDTIWSLDNNSTICVRAEPKRVITEIGALLPVSVRDSRVPGIPKLNLEVISGGKRALLLGI